MDQNVEDAIDGAISEELDWTPVQAQDPGEALGGVDEPSDLTKPAQKLLDRINMDHLEDRLSGRGDGLRTSKPDAQGDTGLEQYVWRMARFHSGADTSMPVTASWWLQDYLDHEGIDASVTGITDRAGKEITTLLDVAAQVTLARLGEPTDGAVDRWEGLLFQRAPAPETEGSVQAQRGDWERIGNTRFIANDGVGGEARVEHEGDVALSVRLSPDEVHVWSREAGIDIDVDHKGENMASWREGNVDTYPQAAGGGGPKVTFESESEPNGLMKVWEIGEHRAELRYLTRPDSGKPMNSPWHVKVLGPDPLAGGRVDSIWSRSYTARGEAEQAATERLMDKHRKHNKRGGSTQARASSDGWEKVSGDDLREGQRVRVTVNNRASEHLGKKKLEGTVTDVLYPSVTFDFDGIDGTNTWYADIGYIHGYHTGLDSYSDIGKVQYVERRPGAGAENASVSPRVGFDQGETLGYAVYDTERSGFVTDGFYGQTLFETVEEADAVAEPGMHVVEVTIDHLA